MQKYVGAVEGSSFKTIQELIDEGKIKVIRKEGVKRFTLPSKYRKQISFIKNNGLVC